MRGILPEGPSRALAAELFKTLAHEGRLGVLLCLGRRGPMTAGQLQDATGAEQTALSHQLRILREQRLVTTSRRGKHVVYALHDAHVSHIIEDALLHVSEPGEAPAPGEAVDPG